MRIACCFAIIVLGFISISGCKTGGDETINSKTVITSNSVNRISGRQWILQEMTIDGNEHHLTGNRPFIKFSKDGKVSGFASINRFSGSIQLEDQGRVQWSPFRSTRMAGPLELMDQESTFLAALQRTQRFSLEGIYLLAQSKDGHVKLVFCVTME